MYRGYMTHLLSLLQILDRIMPKSFEGYVFHPVSSSGIDGLILEQ